LIELRGNSSSGHDIRARHHIVIIIAIVRQQLKRLEDRALDTLGQRFVAEHPGVRLAQIGRPYLQFQSAQFADDAHSFLTYPSDIGVRKLLFFIA
jgi:hypothetical protein